MLSAMTAVKFTSFTCRVLLSLPILPNHDGNRSGNRTCPIFLSLIKLIGGP